MEESHQIELKITLNEGDARTVLDLLVDIDPQHIPVAMNLLRDPKLFNSLINTRTSLVKDASGERIELRLVPTSLLEFLAS